MNLTVKETEILCMLLSAEIMKMQLHYAGTTPVPTRLQQLYDIRDKLIESQREV